MNSDFSESFSHKWDTKRSGILITRYCNVGWYRIFFVYTCKIEGLHWSQPDSHDQTKKLRLRPRDGGHNICSWDLLNLHIPITQCFTVYLRRSINFQYRSVKSWHSITVWWLQQVSETPSGECVKTNRADKMASWSIFGKFLEEKLL